MKRNALRFITKAMTAALCLIIASSPVSVLAVNEEFDDPDDGVVSQNEAFDDLLNDPLEGAPRINGTSYVLLDSQSGDVLMGRNIHDRLEPASTTKIMTVLLALENLDPEQTINITTPMYEPIPEGYQKLGITDGEQVLARDLIYASLLMSANDAALALAIAVGGSENEFLNMMNERAAEIGCTDTHFTTSYGLADINNVTSAYDLALILQEAISNPEFCEISTTFQYTMTATNVYSDTRDIVNANRFISTQEFAYDYYIGGKTGYTDSAGYTLASAAKKNDRQLIGVILGSTGSEQRYSDMIDLFEFGFSSYTTLAIDRSEYQMIYNSAIDQINAALIDTNLSVMESTMEFSDYISTTTIRVAGGCSNSVELSNVLIDPEAEDQYFNIPLYKTYADGKTYIVGSIKLRISTRDRVIEITPEKKGGWSVVKDILIGVIAVTVLILILLYSFITFRRKSKKRSDEEYRNKSKML